MNSNDEFSGGCFCGTIRFMVRAPASYACFCHCDSCQRAAGAPVVAWATFPRDSFTLTRGDITWHVSSPGVRRGHCRDCGTCISYEHEKREGEIDISLNALDQPAAIRPQSHIWVEDKQPWLAIGDRLPRHGKTVGSD